MAKTKGGGNRILIFPITANAFGTLAYTFNTIEGADHTAQASLIYDFNIDSQSYDAALKALLDVALPVDPSAGATPAAADAAYEDNTGGATEGSSVAPVMGLIYIGPYDVVAGTYEAIAQLIKFDPSSKNLSKTKADTTNHANIKLIGQKPTVTITVAAAKFPAILDTVVGDKTFTTATLLYHAWLAKAP